jgi:RNA polymerase sigma-32 factor
VSPPGKSTRGDGGASRKKASKKGGKKAAGKATRTARKPGPEPAADPVEILDPEIVQPEIVDLEADDRPGAPVDGELVEVDELGDLGSIEEAAAAHSVSPVAVTEHAGDSEPADARPSGDLPVTESASAAKVPAIPDKYSSALVTRDALGAYLAEIRKYPILSREEEHELALLYHETGDTDAAMRLITSNLRLVVMVAREYQRAIHNLLDLIQEGNVGLLEAVKQFDPHRGVRLPSYAVWWIRAYVIRYVMNNFRLVKVGTTQAQRRLFFNLQKEKVRLEREGFTPTAKRIAENLGVKEKEVIEMDLRMGASEVSADTPLGPDTDTTIIALLPQDSATAEDGVADREFYGLMKTKLGEFQETLEGREYEIFTERLLAEDPLTLQELGERYGVSRERVRQIEEALRKRLREFLVRQLRDVPDLGTA